MLNNIRRGLMFKSLYFRFAAILTVGLFAAMPAYAGGGGWFIKPLGLMLGGAMLLTIVLTKTQADKYSVFCDHGLHHG